VSRALPEAESPLAVFCNGLGDHLLTLPALRALAHGFKGRLTLLCLPGARRRFFADLPLRTVIEAPFREQSEGYHEALCRLLPPADLLVSPNPWHRTILDRLLARMEGRPSVGLRGCFSHPVPRDFGKHSADLAFDVARRIFPELKLDDFAQPLTLPAEAVAAARRLRERLARSGACS
jgi:hypothetical protein